jgi:hypothetical protein
MAKPVRGRGPRLRSVGRGRKLRRSLSRGGTGPARTLNTVLGGWDGVRITPMFGRWGYFAGERLFACFPLRDKDHDLWIRLTPEDQARALREAGARPHRGPTRSCRRRCAGCDARPRPRPRPMPALTEPGDGATEGVWAMC